jgi:hypothetical protein
MNEPQKQKTRKTFWGQVNGGKTYAVQNRDDHLNEYYGQCHFHYLIINFLNFIIFVSIFINEK